MDIDALRERGDERIRSVADALDLPETVCETAYAILHRAYTDETQQGRSCEVIATAALYLACKRENVPAHPREIAAEADVSEKLLFRRSKWIQSELDVRIQSFNPSAYVDEYCDRLGLAAETRELARNIVTVTTDRGLASGKSPRGFAAAAVYYAATIRREDCTQSDVHEIADVSKITIRNRYQEQAEAVGDLVTDAGELAVN
jgi:transcription initiation factor TFIIB